MPSDLTGCHRLPKRKETVLRQMFLHKIFGERCEEAMVFHSRVLYHRRATRNTFLGYGELLD